MSWLTGDWRGIHRLTDRIESPWYASCADSPGVYRLIALRQADALEPDTLRRVCGDDETGTLYIGCAKNLRPRIGALVKTHDPIFITKKHKLLPSKLAEVYGPNRLALSFKYTDDAFVAKSDEAALLLAYKAVYGEGPPLNSQG